MDTTVKEGSRRQVTLRKLKDDWAAFSLPTVLSNVGFMIEDPLVYRQGSEDGDSPGSAIPCKYSCVTFPDCDYVGL